MDNDRYLKIDRLIDAALEVEPAERASFLDQACGEDLGLREEVDSLLAAYQKAGDFIESPALDVAARVLAQDSIHSFTGKTISRYQIVSLLGEGGMGQVYLGHDDHMNRKVAVKILHAHLTLSPDSVARFRRESRAASALNHPNIITIYEIGQDEGVNFIASELVEGETLRQKIHRGKLNVKEAIELAMQASSALAAAHSAGIVHRDIKPENIMIRRDGYVKVLDFGLAKLTEKGDDDDNGARSHSTQAGTVLGTINYMSPEQARGLEIDVRTDIFSLGIVLYEMVTGNPPFKGATAASTFDAILNSPPPPISSSNPQVSSELVRIINRALEKDREVRYQTASDLRAELRMLQKNIDSLATASAEAVSATGAFATNDRVSARWKQAAIALGILALAAPAGVLVGKSMFDKPALSWLSAVSTRLTSTPGLEYFPSLSPDGKSLVYAGRATGNFDIYLKRIGSRKTVNLTESSSDQETQPVFSPDGKRIAFRRTSLEGSGIYVMTEAGESVRRLTDYGNNPAWSPDSKEIVCTEDTVTSMNRGRKQSRMWIVNSSTGESRTVAVPDAVQPSWSPDGRRIAFWASDDAAQRDIWTVAVAGGSPVQVTADAFVDWGPVWSPDGQYLYFISNRKGTMSLWRVGIDQSSGKVTSEPESVPTPASETFHISFSSSGRSMAFVGASRTQNIGKLTFDPAKEKIINSYPEVIGSSGEVTWPSISPDGQTLTCHSVDTPRDIFALSLGGSILNQLTDDDHNDLAPAWSPDGRRIAYYSNKSGAYQIWLINPDGSRAQQITYASDPGGVVIPIWSPDGSRMAFSLFGGKTQIMDLTKPWNEQTLIDTAWIDPVKQTMFVASSWSPDGKYLAGSGYLFQVHQGLFAYLIETQRYEMISSFGLMPRWLVDNKRCVFVFEDRLFVTDRLSRKPREIFSIAPNRINGLAISRDNQTIYISVDFTEADIWLLTVS